MKSKPKDLCGTQILVWTVKKRSGRERGIAGIVWVTEELLLEQ